MEPKSRLAVFEHVPHKERSSTKTELKTVKRNRSPETNYDDHTVRPVKKIHGVKLQHEPLALECYFMDCDFETKDYYKLLDHVDDHCNKYLAKNGEFNCLWDDCLFFSSDVESLRQHLKYHVYHLKLSNIGQNMIDRTKLPACKREQLFQVPTLPNNFMCEWTSCNMKFVEYQKFVDHVKCHVNATPKKSTDKDEIKCEWTGCSSLFPLQYRLLDHVKIHTKEKTLACPTCGSMFSTKTKFIDHCRKQVAEEMKGYQCSQCFKLFASERLLRDHMRIHINHYKCHLCDMTCITPSCLAKHIRYRHLTERPFKCDICSQATVSYHDLIKHRETHCVENKYECTCGYKCRAKVSFNRHIKTIHEHDWEYKYVCHCCNKRFPRGGALTKHLIKVHNFHWPSGHSRFLYKQDAKTGQYHLQIVRYESLEVTQEMIEGSSIEMTNTNSYKFDCEQSKDDPHSYVLKLATNDEDNRLELQENIPVGIRNEMLMINKEQTEEAMGIDVVEHAIKYEISS